MSLIAIGLTTGCTPSNDPVVRATNKSNLSKSGEYIGTFDDGRSLYRYIIDNGSAYDHYVYIVKTDEGVEGEKSINYPVKSGKNSTRIETIVVIDGVEYIRK